MRAERLKSAAELLVLRHDTLKLIDGAGPEAFPQDHNKAEPADTNEKGPERQTVPEEEQQNPTKTVETAKELVQTSTSAKCTFSRMVILIDPKRFTDSSVLSVECASLWKNAFTLPSQGHPQVPAKRPTQNPDRGEGQALVGHRKNRLESGCRREKPMEQKMRNHIRACGQVTSFLSHYHILSVE